MLSCINISYSYDNQPIFDRVNLKVGDKEKIGLVGPNGVGKTTLLKIMAGLFKPHDGKVDVATKKLSYLPQEFSVEQLSETPSRYLEAGKSNERQSLVKKLFSELQLDLNLQEKALGNLSGGERAKVALIKLLLTDYDLYLLDEPTNNLDQIGLERLEKFVINSDASFVIISHDRKFLDRTVGKVVEVIGETRNTKIYAGNYSDYWRQKQADLENQWEKYQDYRDKVASLESSIVAKKEWAVRGQNKPIQSDNDKFIRGKAKDYASGLARAAKNIEKRKERLEEDSVDKPKFRLPLNFSFDIPERSGDLVFEVAGVKKSWPGGGIGPIDLVVNYGQKIAILGQNGVGKSTLLNILTGKVQPDVGSVKLGSGVKIGYLEQFPFKNTSETVLESMLPLCDGDQTETRRLLHRFQLSTNDIIKPINLLSPGERSRLILASLVAGKPNCLILDEPSNHLDLEAITFLEKALQSYAGTLIVVTHDRYFLEQIKPGINITIDRNGALRSG